MPRQLVLETLDSVQNILFPLVKPKPQHLLKSLIKSEKWDPDIRTYEFSTICNEGEENIPYYYFASRLSQLQTELENPRPRGWLERQIERRTANRYMMMATLAGVILAVLLGVMALAVSCYQTWIAYQAWQHPVPSNRK